MDSKHQNAWADFAEWIALENGFMTLVLLFNIIAFFFWVYTDTFFGAIIVTLLGSFFIGGIPALLIDIVALILSRYK